MDSRVRLYLERAENELLLAVINFNISTILNLKKLHNIPLEKTFFNDVISECYYTIFYSAKAYLLSKGIRTLPPAEHKKTYNEFKRFIDSGKLNKQLLGIYTSEKEKAEVLLHIFHLEKKKRGRFVYHVNANANIPYAKESLNNAKQFLSIMKAIIGRI